MIRRAAYLLTCLTLVLAMGCTARRHLNSGDAAWDAGDMHAAAYHYEQAMSHRSSLQRDSAFLSRLAFAQSRDAYDTAVQLRREGAFTSAVQLLEIAIEKDPSFEAAHELMPQVQAEATRKFYGEAVAAADRGDLDAAGAHLDRAMQYDRSNPEVLFAIASLSPGTLAEGTPGLAEYRQGVSLSAELRWALAEQSMQAAVGLNPGLLPARAGLKTAKTRQDESLQQMRNVEMLMGQRNMGQAIADLERALIVWPTNPQALSFLSQAQAQRALAVERFNAANRAAADGDWDQAIAIAQSGYDIDISYGPLNIMRRDLPDRAATYYTHQGDGLLDADDLDAAFAAYGRALSYSGSHREANRGIASVYSAWAAQLESADRPGAALLHYTRALSFQEIPAASEGVARTTAVVQNRVGMGIGLSLSNDWQGGTIDPGMVGDAVFNALSANASRGLAVQGEALPYTLRLTLRQATIDQQLAGTRNRTQHYTTTELRHNDEYDRVADRLRRETETLHRYCDDYQRSVGHSHHGHDPFHDTGYSHLYNRVENQEREVADWQRRLSRTPHQIEFTVNHTWPYTVETYSKTGQLVVLAELIDTASGAVIDQAEHRASFATRDDQVLNANPSVGVRYDRLDLPGDASIRSRLIADHTGQTVPWAIELAVDHRLSAITAQVDALLAANEPEAGLEAQVDAALLIRLVDPESSTQSLRTLIRQHTR